MPHEILGISGSLRPGSSNTALLRAFASIAAPRLSVTVFEGLGNLPHFSPEIDTDHPPDSVRDLREQLDAADGVAICTPEYAFGMPGSLKNALDWLVSSGEIDRKPLVAIAASPLPSGGESALANLLIVMKALNARIPPNGALSVATVRRKLNESGVVTDTGLADALSALADSLALEIERS